MSRAIETLFDCAERQRQLFYEHFLSRHRVGEILCVQTPKEDTVLFERWEIHNKGLISTTLLKAEDTLISEGINVTYQPIEAFVRDREQANKERFIKLDELLKADGMTIEEAKAKAMASGQDGSQFDYREITRASLEDRLPPGKKTIQGDRRSEIMVLERQVDIPSDLQQARLNVYRIYIPEFIKDFIECKEESEQEAWLEAHTSYPPQDLPICTKLPFIKDVHEVHPTIYEWPDKEIDVEKAVGYK